MSNHNKKRPAISVVVPAYNEEDSIAECLSYLRAQNFNKPYEIIVVDGPSTDNTSKISKRMGARVFNVKQRGISLAWKIGSEKAKSPIVAFTEADTVVPKNWLSKIYQTFNENQAAVGIVGTYNFKGKSKLNYFVAPFMYLIDNFHKIWKGHYAFRGTNFAVRKTYLKKCGGFDTDIKTHGDVELSLRISKFGKIIYVPDLKVQTTNRHLKSPLNFIKFLIRAVKAVYYIEIVSKPKKINKMFDIR